MPMFSTILSYILFADDTTGIYTSSSLDDTFTVINNEINLLQIWFSSNNLQLNANKTNLVLFMTRQKETCQPCSEISEYHLTLDEINIAPSAGVKFLGLYLDKNLTFREHINIISKKISKAIYVLSRAARVLPRKELITLYSSLILPYLNYGLLVWGGSCGAETCYRVLDRGPSSNPMGSLTQIHKLQKSALRVISGKSAYAHHIPLCHSLNLLDLEHLYCIRSLSLFYDYFHGKLPPFFLNKFSLFLSRDNSLHIKTKYRRTELASSTIFHTLSNTWNTLPNQIKSEIHKSKSIFIKKVKEYYISLYQNWECEKVDCFSCNKS